MRLKPFVAVFALFAALAGARSLAAQELKPRCREYLGQARTAYDSGSGAEFGEVRGTVNGSLLLRYRPELEPIDAASSKPNLLVKTEDGLVKAWLTGTSEQRGKTTAVDLRSTQATADGQYAGATIILRVIGQSVVRQGGDYELAMIVCRPTR